MSYWCLFFAPVVLSLVLAGLNRFRPLGYWAFPVAMMLSGLWLVIAITFTYKYEPPIYEEVKREEMWLRTNRLIIEMPDESLRSFREFEVYMLYIQDKPFIFEITNRKNIFGFYLPPFMNVLMGDAVTEEIMENAKGKE